MRSLWIMIGVKCLAMLIAFFAFIPQSTGEEVLPSEPEITAGDRDYWAFRPVIRPEVPAVKNPTWVRTPIDAFILSKLESKGISPGPEADRATLRRRLHFDVIGLPPTLEDLQHFEAETTPDAYEREVDRLLASQKYGEHWAQFWLDLARFAETDGFEHDKVRPDAWKYRDWVISTLNADMPYDEFVRLQLAADVLTPGQNEAALMFCLAGPDMPDINDQVERRHRVLNEMTGTVGSVFLGLQMGCAECHDHKYDPISQVDFYRLRAVFESSVPDLKRDVPYNVLRKQAVTPVARFWVRGDHRRPGAMVKAAFPRIADISSSLLTPAEGESPRLALAKWITRGDNPLTARVMVNRIWAQHFGKGLFATPSDVGLLNPGPSHRELLDWLACEFQASGWSLKALHRLILTSATYRQASRSRSEDMDWNNRCEQDPENALYSRFPRRRISGEMLRDALLTVSGLMTEGRGGPGVMPPLPEELVGTLLKGQWTVSPRREDHYRRSIYLFARRNLRYPLFEAFDRPDANASCAVRNRSTTAPQALVLWNGPLSLEAAQHLAGEIGKSSKDPQAHIEQLYRRTYGRKPTPSEEIHLQMFLNRQKELLRKEHPQAETLLLPSRRAWQDDPYLAAAWVDACLAVLNSNEFLYVD